MKYLRGEPALSESQLSEQDQILSFLESLELPLDLPQVARAVDVPLVIVGNVVNCFQVILQPFVVPVGAFNCFANPVVGRSETIDELLDIPLDVDKGEEEFIDFQFLFVLRCLG